MIITVNCWVLFHWVDGGPPTQQPLNGFYLILPFKPCVELDRQLEEASESYEKGNDE